MYKIKEITNHILAGLLLSLFLAMNVYAGESVEGKEFFTRINIWYENPKEILSTNYHMGAIIPLGTKVTVTEIKNGPKKAIHFLISDKGLSFSIFFVEKHSNAGTSLIDVFHQYFAEKNPLESEDYNKLSPMEKEKIKKGSIAPGMSKSAVLMAYGFPPSHKTPSLNSDIWTYWENRITKQIVVFQDEKITKISETNNPF